ncbi:MAG TPA: amino acid ABC transporter permease [Coxiellaceae bacterium]|nr:amino acid ABC transporter permease [Coxiellaceae bacterium]HBS52078.1 amino acid ABC transporter permease [Coxiellaceae bacterium]HBY55316.1 amino acid ABC transporter permease [Coxiellaceae bacterium]
MISSLQNICLNLTGLFWQILPGIKVVFELFILTMVFSIPLGIILAIGRLSNCKILSKSIQIYIWVMRGTPLMLQLIFVYFGMGNLGINIERFPAAVITFVLNYAAYYAEIFRSGIQSIERSQFEGAEVLGLNYWQTMRHIILPQTLKRVLPPIGNEVVTLIKDTSLAQVIGIVEVFTIVKITAAREFVIYPFLIAATFYLIMTYIFTKVFDALEKHYAYYE